MLPIRICFAGPSSRSPAPTRQHSPRRIRWFPWLRRSEFSHNRLPQKAAQIITRLFGFATALSDCSPFALSQPATAVSELNRLLTSRPPAAGRTGSMAGSIWYGSALSGGQGAIRRPTGCSHAQRISLKRNLRGASQGFAAFCTHALDLSWKKSVCE